MNIKHSLLQWGIKSLISVVMEPLTAVSSRRVFETPSDEYRNKAEKANSKAKFEYSQYCEEKQRGNTAKAKEHYNQSQLMYGYSRKCSRRAKELDGISWKDKRKMDEMKRSKKQ